jgi:TonB family protein
MRWGSLCAALVLHAAFVAFLAIVLAPAERKAAEGDTSWIDLALVGPEGGGGETGGEAEQPRVDEPEPPAEAPPADVLTTSEVDVAELAPVDSIETPETAEDAVAMTSEGIGTGIGDDVGQGTGGQGGGAGGGSGGGIGPGIGPGMGGGGMPPQPLHLVVPQLPRGVDAEAARGKTVALLVQVRPDGTVSDVRVDRSSGIPALDRAALVAALRMRYRSAPSDTLSQWARTELRF